MLGLACWGLHAETCMPGFGPFTRPVIAATTIMLTGIPFGIMMKRGDVPTTCGIARLLVWYRLRSSAAAAAATRWTVRSYARSNSTISKAPVEVAAPDVVHGPSTTCKCVYLLIDTP
jgi:hypothetical protein